MATFPPLTITSVSPIPTATIGVAYGQPLTAVGGTLPYSWVGTNLPPGLTLSSGGLLSGVPTTLGAWGMDIHLTDGAGTVVEAALTINVFAPTGVEPLVVTCPVVTVPPVVGMGMPPVSALVSGGHPPYTFIAQGLSVNG